MPSCRSAPRHHMHARASSPCPPRTLFNSTPSLAVVVSLRRSAMAVSPFLLCLLLTNLASTLASSHTHPPLISSLPPASAGSVVSGEDKDACVYTIYIRTGTIWKGGTDSVISLALAGAGGEGVQITDLVQWGGLMGNDHDYFERGNLDIFSGRGPCLFSPPCWMNLTSDGSGPHHGWYCNYVEVTTTGPHIPCAQQLFTVEQWLARDASPYRLYAVCDNCRKSSVAAGNDVRVDAGVM